MALHSHEQSLSAIFGKKVVDVAGYVTDEFGEDTLTFKITRILFEDDSALYVEPLKHDMPYIPSSEGMQALLKPHFPREDW